MTNLCAATFTDPAKAFAGQARQCAENPRAGFFSCRECPMLGGRASHNGSNRNTKSQTEDSPMTQSWLEQLAIVYILLSLVSSTWTVFDIFVAGLRQPMSVMDAV